MFPRNQLKNVNISLNIVQQAARHFETTDRNGVVLFRSKH